MKRLIGALLMCGLVVFTGTSVSAQEAETESDEKEVVASATEGRVFEDQITVTAGRQEQLSSEVPAPVTVITSEDIEMLQPEKMVDLFKMIPGVEVQGEGPFRGIPVIRGLTSNRVLILVDGQRLNNGRESTSFAGIQPALVNLGEVERIEVLRGPAAVQYGSDAIGGVVNIITRQPDLGADTFKINGHVSYEYGTAADSQNGQVRVSGAGKRMGFNIGGAIEEADDYKAASGAHEDPRYTAYTLPDDTVPNSQMKQTAFDGSFRVLTGDQGVFKVNAEVVRTEDVGFPGFDPVTSGIDISFPSFDRSKLGVSWASGKMGFLDDLSLSAWYQTVDKESIRNFSFPGFAQNSYTRSEIDSIGFNAQGVSTVGINHLTYGLDYYQDELHDTSLLEYPLFPFIPPSDEVVVPDSTQQALGLYISDGISATDRLTFNVGLRGDYYNFDAKDDPRYFGESFDVNDSALSGNLGVIYSLTDHVNLTGLVARGFRTPNTQERTFYGPATTGDTWIVQNPDLSPESSWNYEAGFKVRYERASGGLNFFYNDLSDFIGFRFIEPGDPDYDVICADVDPNFACSQFDNIDKATIWGIELDMDYIFARWWSVFGSFAYLEGDNKTTGEPLSSIPPWKVTAGIRYQRSSWWGEADVRYVGKQTRLPTDDPRFETGTDPFTVVNLRGGYDFAFGLGVLVSFGNVLDELYNEPYNNRPEPGRNVRATLRYRF